MSFRTLRWDAVDATLSWVVPAGATSVTWKLLAPGGPGGSVLGGIGQGGGGSGGCYATVVIATTPGETLTITLPPLAGPGADAGDVSVSRGGTVLVLARGGKQGGSVVSGRGTGAVPDTTGSVGDTFFAGGAGGDAPVNASGGGGGGAWDAAGHDAAGSTAGAATAPLGGAGGPGNGLFADAGGIAGTPYGGAGAGAVRTTAGSYTGGPGGKAVVQAEFLSDTPFTAGAVLGTDHATGGNTDEIDGRTADGNGDSTKQFLWRKHPTYLPGSGEPQAIGIRSQRFQRVGFAERHYLATNVNGLTPNNNGSRSLTRFRQRDTVTIPAARNLIWSDDFDGPAGTPLSGRVHSGGSAGTGTWTRVNVTNSDGAEAELDGDSRVRQPPGPGPDAGNNHFDSWYAIRGLTLPTLYEVEYDVYEAEDYVNADGPFGRVGVFFRQSGDDALNSYWMDWSPGSGGDIRTPYHFVYHGASGHQTVGAIFGYAYIPALKTRTWYASVRGTGAAPAYLRVGWYGDPDDPTFGHREEASLYDGQFTNTRNNYDTGDPGISFGTALGNAFRFAAVRIYEIVPGTSGEVFEFGYIENLLNHDPDHPQGYSCTWNFSHDTVHGVSIELEIWDQTCTDPTDDSYQFTRILGPILLTDGGLPMNFEDDYELAGTLETDPATGHPTIYAWARLASGGGAPVLIASFDLVTDLADFDLEYHDGGLPGISIYDEGADPDSVTLDEPPSTPDLETRIIDILGRAGTVPCTGPPVNPYPNPPPLPPPGTLPKALIWVMRNFAWREVPVPIVGATPPLPSQVSGYGNLASRLAVGFAARANLDWRYPFMDIGDVTGGGGDLPGGFPPGYDPCEILNPGTLPPPLSEVPIPFAGGRWYGLGDLPITLFGTTFNGAQRTMFDNSILELSQAAARNGHLALNGATRGELVQGGRYQPALYDARIAHFANVLGPTLTARTADGTLAYITIFDDFKVPQLWPPSGISDAEIARVAAEWHAQIPGIRLGLRIRPRGMNGPIPGVQVFATQYDGAQQVPGGRVGGHATVDQLRGWRDAEMAKLRSFGPGHYCTLHPNYLASGDGTSGIHVYDGTLWSGRWQMSPTEVRACADAWFGDGGGGWADLIIGSTGYHYIPSLLASPGMMDAITYFRNGLMSLPPL